MKLHTSILSPLDIVVLLKIIAYQNASWTQAEMAEALFISQGEVSRSLQRSKYAGLLDATGKKVMRMALLELLQYGIRYIFPQQPGPLVRGIPTSHSAIPLSKMIESNEHYVWPSGTGKIRGHGIQPLYPSVVQAVKNDHLLYELLALTDALRVGKAREKELALDALKKHFFNGEPGN